MRSLFSALVIKADAEYGTDPMCDLFDYGSGQRLPLSSMMARRTHTNIPRASYAGIPMGWQADILSWRAFASLSFLVDPVLEWASSVELEFDYDNHTIERANLAELLVGSQIVCDSRQDPIGHLRMRENIPYRVRVTFHGGMLPLQKWLIEHNQSQQPKMTFWIHLEGQINWARY